ncbi:MULTISPECIES: KfrB domain-containing protein [Burkholderiales]|uniref:KfrB domain-containing protein n=1 Tax=Burkholderiales TaxID=80840 RepID=UPI000AAB800F|nr:KfrB domain-containing protein [Thiomonas intermedia]QGW60306.1 TraP [bacterium]BCT98295.1 hypothetical protein [uncultured bacterium]BCT98347.1 hypothetical protein [uncultured bacterium]BCT98625.1 hypothetical protein [uncultured bacterium]BCT99683.1 hypothetical protein [uncultured bacterium]
MSGPTTAPVDGRRELKPEGHELLLIANESRLLDKVVDGAWQSNYIGSRGGLPKGLYDLTGAERPGKTGATKSFEGNVLHVDKKHVYQLQSNDKGKSNMVRHDLALYKAPPAIGTMTKVDYVRGAGQVVGREQTLER